ncbi:MAG: M3 family oligoendopeptidase, partial [Candidatus Paceibacteria bacterium]
MSFAHVAERPSTLTKQWTVREYAGLLERLEPAEESASGDRWLQLFADWNALKSYVDSEYCRLSYLYSKDLNNTVAEEAEKVHREEITPEGEKGDAQMVAGLLGSKHRAAIAERYGDQLLRYLEVKQPALAPQNSELRVQDGALVNRYEKLLSSGEVDVEGTKMTLERARSFFSSDKASTRRAAFDAYFGWFLENREQLAEIYSGLVALRDQQGKRLGHQNFVPLGYSNMERTDYGPTESADFRASVARYASPLFEKLCAQQAACLGQETLRPWDAGYHPELTLPMGVAEPVGEQLDKMERVFDRLSPKLSSHFKRMRREGLIDLENRKGKGAGAFCTSFSDEASVAILCNSTGDESDIGTLAHEMGHAFQGWESQWIEAVDLRWPSSDACEIHSMGMEYLSLPFLDEFLNPEQLETFKRDRWRSGISLICYVCTIDEFQHWVYEHPGANADERDTQFAEIRSKYMPGLDWSGEAAKYESTRWYAQLHVFC